MKYMLRQPFVLLIPILMLSGIILTSCDEDDSLNWPSASNYSIIAYVDDLTYLVSSESLDTGTVSIVGNGLELPIWLSKQVGEDYYFYNGTDYNIDKYTATGSSFNKIDAISLTAIIPGGRPRVLNISDAGSLTVNGWADIEGNVEYGVINLEDFSVTKYGTVQLPAYKGFAAAYRPVELIISGDKAYFATLYSNAESNDFPGLTTVVFDYPSFENGTVIELEGTQGQVGSHVGNTNIVDENGDIYQVNLTSKHWFGADFGFTSVVAKISDGAYDQAYDFNISTQMDKDVDVWGLMYAGNGIAYARASYEDVVDDVDPDLQWRTLTGGNSLFLIKLDLYNRVTTKLNVPLSSIYYTQDGASANGNFYFPISVIGESSNIYAFDNEGDADGFTKGAALDGENVTVGKVFVH